MSAYPSPWAAEQLTLFDLLDTALDKGVVLFGEATISVADVDLVFLGIKLVLSSVETMDSWRRGDQAQERPGAGAQTNPGGRPGFTGSTWGAASGPPASLGPLGRGGGRRPSHMIESRPYAATPRGGEAAGLARGFQPVRASPVPRSPAAEGEKLEKGLAKLVLTVVELLRRLLEEQALRRMEGGSLSEAEVERMGQAFDRLAKKMTEIKRVLGFEGEELNLDLGPLGDLM